MAKKVTALGQVAGLRIQQFGERLRIARLRRRLTAKHLAECAGMTVVTLRNLERGNSGVTIGAYLAVMEVLGVDGDLDLLLRDDPLGRQVQDANLPQRGRGRDSPMGDPKSRLRERVAKG
ncbi:TPA: helix-turn-helix domain-containing protein [Burkholderia orbicola]|uniref:helix-turn-helix domain-containing protein n=1 Tax=Burkholderia cenocepacia TaxID=95486 RepID=UPI00222E8255|nr:helix-turn-helix domain-containing protein [Burkholderia cenocepacia]MCW3663633.1 helix-turn-helix domain-containing protein [Burkholderia cenocepacia]MDS0808197.1 helix-turn-helix domain-containing protein [Burkholderia cenocepacia]